jgi:hypothetical protein
MKLGALLISALALGACGDNDDGPSGDDGVDTGPREFAVRIENIAPWTVLKAGTQPTRTDAIDGTIGPTQAYEIRFTAGKNQFVSFVTMLGESNDWFFAPGPEGIPLYTDGRPTSGDVTRYVRLWDAGTELDQEPAVGDATGPRQPARNFGAPDPDPLVREAPMTLALADGRTFVRPAVAAMIRVTLTPAPEQGFVMRIENVSTPTTLVTSLGARAVHMSPVVYAVHRAPGALFTVGTPARENGLESLAEAGLADPLGTALRNARGIATPLSPGVFVVHRGASPLFAPGNPDFGVGLERLAEDGDQRPLLAALDASPPAGSSELGAFDTPVGATAPGPALPGQAFEFVVTGSPGDAVSFATMFGMSNDWFFATKPEGIALFYRNFPRSCDVTSDVALYDLGTESDEEPDVGPNTATQQPAPDTGRPDRVTEVREVTLERYGVPEVLHLRVTLTPL